VVEPAFALSIARERGGTEQGEDYFEVFTRLEREFEIQREIVTGLGVAAVKTPDLAVRQNPPNNGI